ncbi:MAG: DUF4276 family protein [Sideroxydans sp.]|nr:DUF4276 family protein [Sideroxydans sp.]
MKKSFFVVEGQTERIFIERFIEHLAVTLQLHVVSEEYRGDSLIKVRERGKPAEADFIIRIIDVGNDEKVRSYVDENAENFKSKGFQNIFGLRDQYTGSNVKKVSADKNAAADKLLEDLWGGNIEVVIAVQETEAWFMAAPNFFSLIDSQLTLGKVSEILGYDLSTIQVELIPHPASEINKVLSAVKKSYRKKEKDTYKIVDALDYETLYLEKSAEIYGLGRMCALIDSALTEPEGT